MITPHNDKITGVLHHSKSQKHYQLRRYLPNALLANLVEQFWLVDWLIAGGKSHVQQNLPDPNFHLVFEKGVARLVGPVSKVYSYHMQACGRVIGVKFNPGVLKYHLCQPVASYVDTESAASVCFSKQVNALATALTNLNGDEQIVDMLQSFLTPYARKLSDKALHITAIIQHIKACPEIVTVKDLVHYCGYPERTLQRHFKQYVGLSPKWLIRKYRLHEVLDRLERQDCDIAEQVVRLGYTDQSHLIRDFKSILGVTPTRYANQNVKSTE